MQLSEAAARLLSVLDPEGILIGGICGALYGVERFTRDVDIAAELAPEDIVRRLRNDGITAEVRRSSTPADLSWVVHGTFDGIDFQVLPAAEVGITVSSWELRAGLRVADMHAFVTSKCIASGQQHMHDVAALAMIYPELKGFCLEMATKYHCLDKLESWLDDKRMQQRYAIKTS